MIWHHLWNPASSSEVGTLYSAKNFLHAQNATVHPMDSIDASSEFLANYTEALVLSLFDTLLKDTGVKECILQREHKKKGTTEKERGKTEKKRGETDKERERLTQKTMDSTSSRPTEPQEETKQTIITAINTMINKFALSIAKPQDVDKVDIFSCNLCEKRFKSVAGMRQHQQRMHGSNLSKHQCPFCCQNFRDNVTLVHHLELRHSFDDQDPNQPLCKICTSTFQSLDELEEHTQKKHQQYDHEAEGDFVLNYSLCALNLGLLALAFVKARRAGDGIQIMRLYKYLLLAFRLDNKSKYTLAVFLTLCQTSYLLPENLAHTIVFNRFTNKKGGANTNVEIDRTVEHWNKIFKEGARGSHGIVTDDTITRASKSYQAMANIANYFNEFISSDKSDDTSVHNKRVDDIKGVRLLRDTFTAKQIFIEQPEGRLHKSFPTQPKNLFNLVDIPLLKDWMMTKSKEFEQMSVYKQFEEPEEIIFIEQIPGVTYVENVIEDMLIFF